MHDDLTENLGILLDDAEEMDTTEPGICAANEVIPPLNNTRVKAMYDGFKADANCPTSSRDTAELDVCIATLDDRKRRIKESLVFNDSPWSTEKHYQTKWEKEITTHQSHVSGHSCRLK